MKPAHEQLVAEVIAEREGTAAPSVSPRFFNGDGIARVWGIRRVVEKLFPMKKQEAASRGTAQQGFAAGLVALRAQGLEPSSLGYAMRDAVLRDELTSDEAVTALLEHYAELVSEPIAD